MTLRILAILIILQIATSVSAAEMSGSCHIQFFGESTLHGFEGQVACQPFVLADGSQSMPGQENHAESISVRVAEMDTDNASRDKKLRTMFQSEAYPLIQGLFANIDADQVVSRLQAAGETSETLNFDLNIREITLPIQAAIRDLKVAAEKVSFSLQFPLSLASFQLEPPSVLGFIRVNDKVQVEVRVVLQRQ